MGAAEIVQAIFRFQLAERREESERALEGREAPSCCTPLRAVDRVSCSFQFLPTRVHFLLLYPLFTYCGPVEHCVACPPPAL